MIIDERNIKFLGNNSHHSTSFKIDRDELKINSLFFDNISDLAKHHMLHFRKLLKLDEFFWKKMLLHLSTISDSHKIKYIFHNS